MSFAYVNADPGIPIPGTKGSSIHVASVCREFARRGMSGAVYAARPTAECLDGIPIVPLPSTRAPAGKGSVESDAWLVAGGLRSGDSIDGRIDLVYERYSLWHLGGLARARDLGVPFVLEVNSPLPEEAQRYRGLQHFDLAVGIARLLMRQADGIVCVSEKIAAWVADLRGASDGVWIVPNGVDPELFSPEGASESLPWPRADVDVIAFAGSFRPWHGVEDLLDAFRILVERGASRARLLCIGDGPLRESFEQRARATGLDDLVHVTGMVPQAEVARWLRNADIAVAPYPVLEGFYFSPLKIYEFMASGLPVVAADVGQVSEVVPDGVHGRLYPPGNRAALAEALLEVLNRREDARRMARAGRAWTLENATWSRRVDSILGRVATIGSGGSGSARRSP